MQAFRQRRTLELEKRRRIHYCSAFAAVRSSEWRVSSMRGWVTHAFNDMRLEGRRFGFPNPEKSKESLSMRR
jgi:hypothetical protein